MLEEYLVLSVFQTGLVFVRLGTAFMLIPGFSSGYVSPRIRLLFALALSAVVVSLVQPTLPTMPKETASLVRLIVLEVFFGVFLGMIGQATLAAVHFAGTVISVTSGLANAMVFDPVSTQQGALTIAFLNMTALVLIFVTGLHHVVIEAVTGSYVLFPPGSPPILEDHLSVYLQTLARAFYIGLQLSSPFIVFSIVFQTMMGLMARLSQQMPVFFVAMPLQIVLALLILWVGTPSLILWFLNFMGNAYSSILPG